MILAAAKDSLSNTNLIIAVIVGVTSITGAILTGWFTYRAAKRNTQTTRQTEEDKLSVGNWAQQVEAWRTDVVALRTQRAEDLAAYRAEIATLREERLADKASYDGHKEDCAKQVSDLTAKVEALQAAQGEHIRQRLALEGRINALVVWGREVVAIMQAQGITFPKPPPEITEPDLISQVAQD